MKKKLIPKEYCSLKEVAQYLKELNEKVQLIYAFNGVGKTRLSREFKENVTHEQKDEENHVVDAEKILYYNAFTEDLFYWDNDLDEGVNRKLKIHPNSFTSWIFEEEGQSNNIIRHFQYYTSKKLTPRFNERYKILGEDGVEIIIPAYSEVTFSIERGNEERIENIKISRGEESCFIWCVFYGLFNEIIEVLNSNPEDRSTNRFDNLEYIIIDDPVSSLDENHLIEIAVNIAELIRQSPKKSNLKFVITTHSPLFYNIIYNELGIKNRESSEKESLKKASYLLSKKEDGTFRIERKQGDSNKSFSYHLFLKQTIEEAVKSNNIQRYHFTLLRNLYEKTANFLGYDQWSDLLPKDRQLYHKRIINFTSHSTLSSEEVAEPTDPEKQTVGFLLDHLTRNIYCKKEEQQ